MSQPNSTTDALPSAGEQAILDAAVRLFSTHGYDGVSMRRIAESAGVSKANIYHHFTSKEALYYAIMRRSAEELVSLLERLAEGQGSFEQRLEAFAEAHVEHLFENDTTVRLVLREAFAGDERKARALVELVVGGIFDRLVAIFRIGQEAGVLRDDLDPGLCATVLVGGDLFYFQAHRVLQQIPEAGFAREPGRYSRQMIDILLHGMLRGRGARRPA